MSVSTNPKEFLGFITVEISSSGYQHCIISLKNAEGKYLKMMGVGLEAGINQIRLDGLEPYTSGQYKLRVGDSSGACIYETDLTKQ